MGLYGGEKQLVYILGYKIQHVNRMSGRYLFIILIGLFSLVLRGDAECSVLVYADGLGFGHAAMGGIPSDAWRWSRGAVMTPSGDSALVTSMLSTGCASPATGGLSMTPSGAAAMKLSEKVLRRGGSYALVSSKCVDDGTASAFTVSWADRYDLRGVASAISGVKPAPVVLSGGFSRSLWTAASVNESSYVEFGTAARSPYAETCEYPQAIDFIARSRDVIRRAAGRASGAGFLAILSFAGVDMASHSGKGVDEALGVLRRTVEETESFLSRNCSRWKLVVVGSHNTGGMMANGTFAHGHHSPGGTLVPLFARGVPSSAVDGAKTMADVARLFAPSLRCAASPRHAQYIGGHYQGSHHSGTVPPQESAAVYFFIILIVALVLFIPCALSEDSRALKRRQPARF